MSNTNLTEQWYETTLGKEIINKKYMHEDETEFEEVALRIANMFAGEENGFLEQIYTTIKEADFFPAGRTLYAAGSEGKFNASYSNCYILPCPEDSIESINEVCGKAARIYSYGG